MKSGCSKDSNSCNTYCVQESNVNDKQIDYIISYSFILDQVGYISTSNPTLNFVFFSSMFDGQGGSVRVWP